MNVGFFSLTCALYLAASEVTDPRAQRDLYDLTHLIANEDNL